MSIKLSSALCSAVLLSIMSSSSASTLSELAGQSLLDNLGRYNQSLRVYKVQQLDQDPVVKSYEILRNLPTTFNTAKFIHLNDQWFAFQSKDDPSATFELNSKTGNFHFNAGLKRYSGEQATPSLPTTEEIKSLAIKHLTTLNLLPPTTEINTQKIEFGGLNMAVPDGKGGSKVFEKLKTLRVYRTLDGLDVAGDSRLIIHLGEKGALAGLVAQWPKVDQGQILTSADLIPADKLREAASATIQRVIAKAQKAELSEAKLVMYDDGQGTIEPAYHFLVKRQMNLSAEGQKANLSMIPYDFYLSASNKPRAVFPDTQSVPAQPMDGKDQFAGNNAQDE